MTSPSIPDRLARSRERMKRQAEMNTAKSFHNWVLVQHQDGSQFMLNYAFTIHDPEDDDMRWVFTEHNGHHLFYVDDLTTLRELSHVPTKSDGSGVA